MDMDPAHLADTTSASPPPSEEAASGRPASHGGDYSSSTRHSIAAYRPRQTRTSTPKVRTGCVTCKKRHVKCDEAKPYCMNCLKTRGVCDGYVVNPRKTRARPPPPPPPPPPQGSEVQRLNPEAAAAAAAAAASSMFPREPDMNALDFDNDFESIYFDDWNDLVRVSLGGAPYSRTKLWTTMMPQLSRQHPALRHAAISIGAMSRALSHGAAGSYLVSRNFDNVASLLTSTHYQNAIVHYCKALRLQGQADFQTASIQEAVLLSILFVAFESLRGNRHSALQHVKFGFVLLQELLMSEDADARIWNLAPDPRQLIAEVLDLYSSLDVQSRTVLSGDVKTSRSPAYELTRGLKARGHTIETYNMQIQRYTDPGEGRKPMPDAFSDADEAYTWWQVCQRRIAKLGPLLLSVLDDLKLDAISDEEGVEAMLNEMQSQPELLAYCEKSVAHLQQWRAAFEPLYNRTLSDPPQPATSSDAATSSTSRRQEYLKTLHLRMHYLVMFLYSFFPKYADVETMASMTPYCREITDVIEILLREQERDIRSPAHVFSIDFGITWQLTVVAVNCRDPLVRENAARLLRAHPRREGLWDSRAFLAVLERNRRLERDNAREGTPAEQWRRLCRREFIFGDAGETIVFRSLRKNEATGAWDLVEETAEFRGQAEGLVWRERPLSGTGYIASGLR